MKRPVNLLGKRRFALLPLLIIPFLIVSCSERELNRAATEQRPIVIEPTQSPSRTVAPSNTPAAIKTPTIQSKSASTAVAALPKTKTPLPPPTSTVQPSPSPQSTSCQSSGRIVTGLFPSTVDGPEISYRIYLPPCYGEDGRAYPTLYLLHGGAHSDDHWDYLGIDEVAEELIRSGTIPPLLIVMPDGGELANNSSGGPRSFEGLFLNDLLPFIESNYCSWTSRQGRAIGGISRGGYWALEIAFRNPNLISSVGGHSAALLDAYAGVELNPQHTALTNDLNGLRIYLDIGDRDYLINQVFKLHEDMEDAGVPHTWNLNDGQHLDSYWSEHLGEYLRWYSKMWPEERSLYPLCSNKISDSLD